MDSYFSRVHIVTRFIYSMFCFSLENVLLIIMKMKKEKDEERQRKANRNENK